MFNINDPYKLVFNTTKYKMNESVESNYYESIKDTYTLKQEYYESGQLKEQCNYIDGKKNGLYQKYYKNGNLQIA
jgi:antitoxin component YwqK of YwqJK toxin-antitoxin module